LALLEEGEPVGLYSTYKKITNGKIKTS